MTPSNTSEPTAAFLIVGNEILSGRTLDKNLGYLASELTKSGIRLIESRVVPDVESEIISAVKALSGKATYVFTSGGIGPTHDDITAEAVAKAFDTRLIKHPEAVRLLEEHYAGTENELNEARLKMAHVPEGSKLIDNPVSKAPGFNIANVYVMAGVPRIMQAMVQAVLPSLKSGPKVHSMTVSAAVKEGDVAKPLAKLQDEFPGVDIGCYPYHRAGGFGASLVARSTDTALLEKVYDAMVQLVIDMGAEPLNERPEGDNAYA